IFFFQAEDGIRDDLVTGVQTCALPIYGVDLADPSARALGRLAVGVRSSRNRPRTRRSRHGPIADAPGLGEARRGPPLMPSRGQRSEERRVGKERSSGGGL